MKDTSHIDSLLSHIADCSAGNLFPRLSHEASRELARKIAEWVDEHYERKKVSDGKSSNHARKRVRLVLRTRHKIKQSKKGGI